MTVLTMENPTAAKFRENFHSYINNFRRNISSFLKPDVGIKTTAYPYDQGSIVKMEFVAAKGITDEVRKPVHSLKDALFKANLNLKDNNGKSVVPNFKGTNIVYSDNSTIYMFKDLTDDEWSEDRATVDVQKIVNG